jgi:hypothetical protein
MVDPVISSSQFASGNTTNLTNTSLTTDFNVIPYYDDYDPNKQFYRILFKPGFAVQARELTQIQSMLQNQIYRFGRHVFKEGSIVLPGGFTLKVNRGEEKANPMDYVKLKDVDTSNNVIDVKSFVGETVTGLTSNIAAYVVDVAVPDGTAANSATLYVTYLSASSSNSAQRVFIAGETLSSANVGTCIVKDNDPVANTGYASWFQIEEGVYFAKEHFIYFPTQSIVLDRYNPNPSCKVGFYVSEEIINAAQDSSLLDPALESSNYSAPGADRLKLLSTLSVLPFDDPAGAPDFVTLFTIRDGVIQLTNEKADYNELGKRFADRTYDESGDYVVRGLNVQVSEHDKITTPVDNRGLYANGNNQLLVVSVDPGYAYVQGYAVDVRDRITIEVEKPTDFRNVESSIISASMGQYLRVSEMVGSWQLDKGSRVDFYDQVQKRITAGGNTVSQKWSTGAQTGSKIGSAIVHSIQYVSGTPGYDAVYDIYLSDVTMTGANAVGNIRSLYYDNSPHSDIGADVVGANNASTNTSFGGLTQAPLLYYVGTDYAKTIRDVNGNPQTVYYYSKTDGISSTLFVPSSGTLVFAPALPTNDILPYGTSTLSAADISQDLLVTINETFNIGPLFSSATVSASGNRLNGIGTTFTSLNVGDKLEIAGLANTYYITSIANNTTLTVSNTVPASVTNNVIFKAYKTGDIINLNGKGVDAGAQRTVQATPTTLTIDFKENLGSDRDITITYKVASTSSAEKLKTLKPNRYVKISCATAGTTGPFNLGFSDVYQIRNIIRKTGSAPTSLSDGTNVTNYFTLDNGQRDTMYDLARIFKSGSITLSASDFLLVELDYFEPTTSGKAGFYTIDSYPIQDNDALSSNSTIRTENVPIYTSSTSRASYDLRNHIDFRPVKTITAADATSIGAATTNPSNTSTTYTFAATGLKFVVPSTEVIYDYSYYLGRKDVVVANKTGQFNVIKGVPDMNPVVPDSLETQMMLAIVDVAPYPSLSPAYGNILKRKDLACSARKVSNRRYTMRDIGILDERIKNLEYYTSLTLLEKDALNLKIIDAETGLDRFKNGIFIDTFRDTALSAAGVDRDYRIANDPIELTIRPLFSTESIGYDTISSSGVVTKNGVALLSYTEAEYLKQTDVTDSRNIERGNYLFRGTLDIFPKQDVWVDTSYAPDEVVSITSDGALLDIDTSNPGDDTAAAITKGASYTVWEGWQRNITGYNLYRGEGANKRLVGVYRTQAEAAQAASQWTTQQFGSSATIQAVIVDSRRGTNYFTSSSTDTAVGSNKLISSEVIPYIRPQTLYVRGYNLKPYSKMNAFFDGINVSQFCTPLTEAQYTNLTSNLPATGIAAEGSNLIVENDGNIYFAYRIEKGKFRTGERKLTIIDGEQIDPDQLSNEADASTMAAGDFFADGTKQVLQKTVYSTKSTKVTPTTGTYEENRSFTETYLPNTWTPPAYHGHCCFDPNAKVLMADFTYKRIADIQPGERVIGADGFINTVTKLKKTTVQRRKMVKFRDTGFYSTDDHLFLTEKGWKTWTPETLIAQDAVNAGFLEGENKTRGIDNDDKMKVIEIVDGKVVENFVDYKDLGAEIVDFASDYEVYDLTLDGNATYVVEGYIVHNCCVAYTVFVKVPNDEEGMFCTGFDVYVQRKSQTRGMWFEIREIDSSGIITNTQIPGSEKRYRNPEIQVSPDGLTNPMQVRFDSPVFLFNNTDYAFIIHSDSPPGAKIDPDTAIWIARMGEKDRNTGKAYNDRQRKGKFYSTTNNRKWDIVEDVDTPITVYRANFNTSTGTITLGNKGVEKLILKNVSSSLSNRVGDYFSTGDILLLSGANGTNSISISDRFFGNTSTSNANGQVVSISGGSYTLSNTGYQIGEKIDVYANNGSYKGISATVASVTNSIAKLSYYSETSANIYSEFVNSSGGFVQNTVIRSLGNSGYTYRGEVDYVGDFRYSSISFEPKVLDFIKTDLNYEMRTVSNAAVTSLGQFESIFPSETTYFEEEKVLLCRSNEIVNLSGSKSNQIRVSMQTGSQYVSPVFDLDTSHSIYIDNIINDDTTDETNPSGGKAVNKYISQTIILADGQDAEDLRVYLSAYRPPNTDVIVYAKFLNGSDGETFNQKNWTLLEKEGSGDSVYSSLSNRFNFREYVYKIPNSNMTGPDGQYQYDENGITFTGYKYFAIKIVLTATNSAVIPRVADLRAIAIQM